MNKLLPKNNLAKLTLILLFFAQLWSNKLQADHYYGGYFFYEVLNEKTYKITLTTYSDYHIPSSDRDSILFYWGDNNSSYILKQNNGGFGEEIYDGMLKNVYVGTHTYETHGNFLLYFSDQFRLHNVGNMALSKSGFINLRFDGVAPIQDSSVFCQNSSPQTLTDPYFYGVKDQELSLNFGYWDLDGDSIVYELTNSLDANGELAEGYFIPEGVSINQNSGQFTWVKPIKGKYTFAFKLSEYRNGMLLGISSTDFTVFISDIDHPKHTTGQGTIISGTTDNTYRFSGANTQKFVFNYTHPDIVDSIVSQIKSPLNTISDFTLNFKSTAIGSSLLDTLSIDYFGNYALNGYLPVIWEVKTYFGNNSFTIQQFPLLIGTEIQKTWTCEVPDISDIYEIAPVIPSFTIAPNLFDDYVWINIGSDFANSTIFIYDTRGRLVKEYYDIQQENLKLDLSDLSSALYYLQVVVNNEVVYTGNMVKK